MDIFKIIQINQIILQKPTLSLCLYCINNLVHIYYKETNTRGGSVGVMLVLEIWEVIWKYAMFNIHVGIRKVTQPPEINFW